MHMFCLYVFTYLFICILLVRAISNADHIATNNAQFEEWCLLRCYAVWLL
jgi:hypothetical protein